MSKKIKAISFALAALLSGALALGGLLMKGGQTVSAQEEKEKQGVMITAVNQTAQSAAKSDVLIPTAINNFSYMRSLEIEVYNPCDRDMPFSLYLQDKLGKRTAGCYLGEEKDSVDFYTLRSHSGEEIEAVGYYNCVFVPAGFNGVIEMPLIFFRSIITFNYAQQPAVIFDYKSVESVVISIDQYYNPTFSMQIGDVNIVTPKETITVRDGAKGAEGIVVQDNQKDERIYTTVTEV